MSTEPIDLLLRNAAVDQQSGRVREAISVLEKVVSRDPRNAEAWARLGIARLDLKRAKPAEDALRTLLKLRPQYANGWKALGAALAMQFQFSPAADAFLEAARLNPEDGNAVAGAAQMLFEAGQFEAAAAKYADILCTDEANLSALLGLGHARRAIGQANEALAAYRRAVALEPRFGQAWWSIANLKTGSFSDADRAAMESAEEKTPEGEAKTAVQFALAKAYEDHGEPDRAFDQYKTANRTARRYMPYNAQADEEYARRIEEAFSPALFEEYANAGHDRPGPIFVVGMPRSGSTLIEQILASHSKTEGLGELSCLGQCAASLATSKAVFPEAAAEASPDRLNKLGEHYLALTGPYRSGKEFFVDKMPNNFFLVGLAAMILPRAVIVDARRHPLDSCVSSFRQFFAKGQSFSYSLDDLAHYYRLYDRLMKHWNAVLPGRILRVDYEALVLDQQRVTERLLAHCNLPYETQCLRFHETNRAVKSASSEQVRTPLYRTGLQSWRRYEKHLGDLQRTLADIIDEAPDVVTDAGQETTARP